jgi:hypothetical protein
MVVDLGVDTGKTGGILGDRQPINVFLNLVQAPNDLLANKQAGTFVFSTLFDAIFQRVEIGPKTKYQQQTQQRYAGQPAIDVSTEASETLPGRFDCVSVDP